MSNHLGNVLAVISDKRSLVSGFQEASVLSAQDYYPFGMIQPGRNFSSLNYRFGFNGKENDNEVKGTGNQQDYGMRIYDPRIGKFLSVDPLTKDFPWYTPYQYSGNNPILFVDLDGQEPWNPIAKYFFNDAALTIAKNPNSNKAKVYGALMGAGASFEKMTIGSYNTLIHPIETLKGLGGMLTRSSIENGVDYGLSVTTKYASMGDNSFTNYAITSELLADILFAVEGTKSLVKPQGAGS